MDITHYLGRFLSKTPLGDLAEKLYYRLYGSRIAEVEISGISAKISTRTSYQYHTASTLGGEYPIVESFLDEIDDNDVIWDIGAHIGRHAAIYGCVSHTVAFEPTLDNFEQLQETLSLNPRSSVIALNTALGTEEKIGRIAETNADSEQKKVKSASAEEEENTNDAVHIKAGRDLIGTTLQQPTALKIDVEGYEGEVISDFNKYLEKINIVLVEIHHNELVGDWSPEDIDRYLTEVGLKREETLSRSEDHNEHWLYIR